MEKTTGLYSPVGWRFFVLEHDCMAVLLEFHAQPMEISDIARHSWATETLHAIRVLQTSCDEYVQMHVQAGFEEVENTANKII